MTFDTPDPEVNRLNTRDTPCDDGARPRPPGTGFSHVPLAWPALKEALLPRLHDACATNHSLRAWMIGCGRGEEAYSLAIMLREALDEMGPAVAIPLRLFATDLDHTAIAAARAGWYHNSFVADVSPERLARFFVREADGFRVKREIRELITFAQHDLQRSPPLTKLDFVLCRSPQVNPDAVSQANLVPLFHYCLVRDGLLMLADGHQIAIDGDLFAAVDEQAGIYRRLPGLVRIGMFDNGICTPLAASAPLSANKRPSIKSLADRALLHHFAPPAVLVNESGDILYFSGRANKFIQNPVNRATWNISAATRADLRRILVDAVAKVMRERTEFSLPALEVDTADGIRRVKIFVRPIMLAERATALIVFQEQPAEELASRAEHDAEGPRAVQLQRELDELRLEILQHEQRMHDLQQELGNANEALQSTNEELIATNDDLRLSNDQVQAFNDDLLHALAERKASHRRIEALSHRLVSIQELERRRLSGDLHDRTSPNLATMDILLKSLGAALPVDVNARIGHLFDDLSALLTDTTASIREICADLRPPVLDHAGLLPALESYAEQFSARTGLAVSVGSDDGSLKLTPEHQSMLFRIAQEALTNSAKHAHAKRVGIKLARRGDVAVLTVADDGIGFSPDTLSSPEQRPGLGLLTMRERAEFAGARFNVSSRPGKGTRITVEIAEDAA